MSSEYYVANHCICIGRNAKSPFDECIVIGANVTSTAPRQLVIGAIIRDLTPDELQGLHEATNSVSHLAEVLASVCENCDEAVRVLAAANTDYPMGVLSLNKCSTDLPHHNAGLGGLVVARKELT